MASLPSKSTTKPSSPIFLAAAAAKVTTSPWVLSATVGMFLATRGAFKVVFFTFETSASTPSPRTLMSQEPSNFPNSSMPMNSATRVGVNALSQAGL